MHRADSPKPPVAPKPKVTTSPSSPAAKFPPSPRPDSFPSPNSMSRGPKPPIAPKPRLTGSSEYGAGVHLNNSLSKCSNGRLLCKDRGLYDGHHSTLNCSELETDEEYIVVPRVPQREDAPVDGATAEQGFEEDVQEHGTEQMGTEGNLAAPDEEAPSRDSEEGMGHTLEGEEDCDHDPETDGTPTAPDQGAPNRDSERGEGDCSQGPDMEEQPMSEEEDKEEEEEDKEVEEEEEEDEEEVKEQVYNLDDRACWDGEDPFHREIVLTPVSVESSDIPCCETGPPETPGEVEEGSEDGCNNTEPGVPNPDTGQSTEDASMGFPENEEVSLDVQEQEAATDSPEAFEEDCEDAAEGGDQVEQEEPPNCDEEAEETEEAEEACNRETATMEVGGDPGEDGDPVQEDPAEENCQIIPFESDSVEEDFAPTLTESPYELFPTESTSFCNNSYSLDQTAKGQEPGCEICPEQVPSTGPSPSQHDFLQDGAGEGPLVPDVVVVPEDEDATDDALSSPYVMGVGLLSLGEGAQSDAQAASGPLSGYSTWEEGDSEGGLVPVDRKNMAARARPHSGKVVGHVPETVLEETGPEACSSARGIRDASEEVRKMGMLPEGKPPESGRALPAKPRAFTLYPRSFSIEGRESPLSMFREPEGAGLDIHRLRRKEDNLSLPGAIGSSGSFSQRSHLPSSGTSTPSSVVDIPPPFDLACITKKPITKSSPSLLIDGDTLEKASKKKKSSFKRFLELTFRKKTESKAHVDMSLSSSRSSSESSYHGPARVLELDRRSLSNSPQLKCRTGKLRASDSPAALIFYRDGKRKGVPFSRTVSRVESFEDRSRPPFLPLPLTKPRSISFPNADTSDYENIPAMNSDYENIQIPPRRPARAGTFTKLFEEQSRALSTANENDGYVDMSSFNAFESKQQGSEQEAESAYTEPYKVCPVSAAPREDLTSDEEQGSSEEEDSASRDPSLTHKVEGQSRALVIAQELLSSEKAYVQMLQHLSLDFHGAVLRALENIEQEGREPLAQEELRQGLRELPAICDLHQGILENLEQRLGDCSGEGQQQVADIFLAREQEFEHHAAFILQFDRCLGLLAQSCLLSPRLATTVREFEQSSQGGGQSMKHRMLRVVQRLFQYQVLLTDYLNNLCPDSAEYDNTQSALTLISKVTDRANESMEQGENLQKLVHIEYSVRGQGDLLQPGREFLKEGTLMRVRGKSRHPRHLFLMNDTLLYTHPQKDGKYRLKSSWPVANMKVSRPVMDKVPYALKIETPESCLTLSASSCAERDEWHYCLTRALPEDYKTQALAAFHHSVEIRERLGISLGERLPTLVPVTHAMMCMNCGCDFSLTVRRHHCHACGKIVCRNCSRNKYPLKCLKNRMAKVCDGCFRELKLRNGPVPGPMRERPVSMSFPLSSSRFSTGSTFSSVFHSISPSTFKKQKKVPSALTEVAASGEGSAISGYLSRCKSGKRRWKKLWLVIKGKVLYTYLASEDKVAMESIPLLGFTIAPEKEEGSSEAGPVFHLYHKKTLFYSFKAEDSSSAQRWMEAMEDASVL
ncbi:FYVE, RhoGEF and PH domain-containing protein 5 isoform X2 [Meriones unguiculatus]|uniref:FYVE, RhoGEF and PH domain-containing protein 5 isoform X2 n=1 Tax=Meriones unguiculatus TaxID=10047 RepID=UPI00293F05D4|nr:FYVE, RhoGEF and PH domain-containing protein 5 isoform X2 [Meriones unguiculatus]